MYVLTKSMNETGPKLRSRESDSNLCVFYGGESTHSSATCEPY